VSSSKRIAVIGAGLVGRAWAIVFARAGHDVAFWDQDAAAPPRALGFVESVLPELAERDLLRGSPPDAVRKRIRAESDLDAALAGAIHVQENVSEDVAVKRAIFAKLDSLAPDDAVLVSSTSAILPSAFTEALPGRHRCMVAHPINPPYLVPAVELVPAPWTSPETVERVRALLLSAGQQPIVLRREIDGFIVNRLQGVLLEEAFHLVDSGAASVEDVDIALRDGLALRWAFMGPFETIDLNAPGGVRDYVERYQSVYARLFPQLHDVDWAGEALATIERERRRRLPADQLADRQKWRDRRLMELVAGKRRAAREIGE